MKVSFYILTLFLMFNHSVFSQLEWIGNVSSGIHQYINPQEDLHLSVDIKAVGMTISELPLDHLEARLQLKKSNKLAGGTIQERSYEFKLEFQENLLDADKYACIIPAHSLEKGRYVLDIFVMDHSSELSHSIYEFAEDQLWLTIGNMGLLSAALHFDVNNGELARDYALVQPMEQLGEFPTKLEGIYTKGFCKDELVALRDMQIHIWKHDDLPAPVINLYYRLDKQGEYEMLPLQFNSIAANNSPVSEYFPGIPGFNDGSGVTDHLFGIDLITEDLIDLVGRSAGNHQLDLYFEVATDEFYERIPETDHFSTSFEVVDAPQGADCQAALLPIELLDFLVLDQDGLVYIQWISALEINNRKYVVERSQNAMEWTEIYQVEGKGNTNEFSKYDFLDRYPISGVGYYRLKQVDLDGSLSYSKVKTVRIRSTEITLFPNPVKDHLHYRIDDPDQTYRVKIYNSLGACVFDSVIPDPSVEQHMIDMTSYPAGTYIIKYINAKNYLSRTAAFVKL